MSSRRVLIVAVCAALAAAFWFTQPRVQRSASAPLPRFASYFMQPTFVDDAFIAVGSVSARPEVDMVLVNHHLLASNFIARTMATVATGEPSTVVLVSPDHFFGGSAPVTSVVARWATPYGDIEPDTDFINALASAGVVHLQEGPFSREHGITNITMFIRKAIPRARLVPIIIRDDTALARIDALARAVHAAPGRIIVVGSFDFTHDATDAVAQANDARSRGLLERGEPDGASDVAVDSKPGIRFLMQLARLRGVTFTVIDMSNSARLLNDTSRTDVTSYITGYWAPKPAVIY